MLLRSANNAHSRLIVDLAVPPSLNNAYINTKHGRRLSSEARDYKAGVVTLASGEAYNQRWKPGASYSVTVSLWFPDHQRRDIDNCVKLPLDALMTALGIDDSSIDQIITRRMGFDPQNPRCIVAIESWGEAPPAKPPRPPRKKKASGEAKAAAGEAGEFVGVL